MISVPKSGTLIFFATSTEVAEVLSPWQSRLEGSVETWVLSPEQKYRVPSRQLLLIADDFFRVVSDNFIQMIVRLRERNVDSEIAFAESQLRGRYAGYLVLQSGYSRWGKSDEYCGQWSLRACDKYLEEGMPPAMPLFNLLKPAIRKTLTHTTVYAHDVTKRGPRCTNEIVALYQSGKKLLIGGYNPHHSPEWRHKLEVIPEILRK